MDFSHTVVELTGEFQSCLVVRQHDQWATERVVKGGGVVTGEQRGRIALLWTTDDGSDQICECALVLGETVRLVKRSFLLSTG